MQPTCENKNFKTLLDLFRFAQCDQTWPFPANLAVFGVRVAGKICRIHYIVAGFRSMCGRFQPVRI